MIAVHIVVAWVDAIPSNPSPLPPPGSAEMLAVLGNIKWIAGGSLIAGFFGGLSVWVAGRLVDHHRFGRIGLIMMLCAVGGGLIYSIGYQIISHFAESG